MKHLLIAVLLFIPISVSAQTPQPTPIPGSYVHDFAGVIPDDQEPILNEKAKQLKASYNTEIGLVTIQSLGGEDIFDYSLRMARDWGIGSKDNTIRGLLIVQSVGDRKIGIRTSGHIEGEITDGQAGTIRREIGRYFARGDEGGGFILAMDMILAIEKEKFEPPAPVSVAPPTPVDKLWLLALLILPAGGIVWLLAYFARRKRQEAEDMWTARQVTARRQAQRYPNPPFVPTSPEDLKGRMRAPTYHRPTPQYHKKKPVQTRRTDDDDVTPSYISTPSYERSEPTYSAPDPPAADPPDVYSGGSDIGGGGSDGSY